MYMGKTMITLHHLDYVLIGHDSPYSIAHPKSIPAGKKKRKGVLYYIFFHLLGNVIAFLVRGRSSG